MRNNKFIPFIIAIVLHTLIFFYFSFSSSPHEDLSRIQKKSLSPSIDLNHFSISPQSPPGRGKQFSPHLKIYPAQSAPLAQESSPMNQADGQPPVSENKAAFFVKIISPTYPMLARQKELEGKVKIKAFYNDQGKITKVDILNSSGTELLDQSVQKAVYEWEIVKGQFGSFEKSFEFKLNANENSVQD